MSASGTCLEEGEIADSGESENENVPKMEMFRDRKKVIINYYIIAHKFNRVLSPDSEHLIS